MHQPATDLFGEVVVTWPDVWAWLEAVPRIPRDSPRAAQYVRDWGVVGKIARAKLEGWFDQAVSPRPAPAAHWWTRFRWAA